MKKILSIAVLLLSIMAFTSNSVNAQKKSVSILGDSYSTFKGYLQPDSNNVWYLVESQGNDVVKVEQTWWHQLITKMDWKLCQNNSYSGSTIAYHGYNNFDFRLRSFENRASDLGNPDIIFIFGATNDSWSGTKVGEYKYSDWDTSISPDLTGELYTYRPALAKMLDYMTKRYINVDIFFILNTELRDDINESTIEICKHYNVPIIYLHDIDKQMGHPSIKGMKQISDQVEAYVKAYKK